MDLCGDVLIGERHHERPYTSIRRHRNAVGLVGCEVAKRLHCPLPAADRTLLTELYERWDAAGF